MTIPPCSHVGVVETPELARKDRGERVFWCPTCRVHYTESPRFFDRAMVGILSVLVGLALLLGWVFAGAP